MNRSESGATLVEALMAAFLLTVALLATALTMAHGISALYMSQEQLLAKQKAQEALESVIMARNTQEVTFAQIQNVADGGIFAAGYKNIVGMGVDGIPNTADDATTIESVTYPGKDGNLGTADDVVVTLAGYTRQITISPIYLPSSSTVDSDVRRIDVDVRYILNGKTKTVRLSSLISRFS